jgi:hypothetical protein
LISNTEHLQKSRALYVLNAISSREQMQDFQVDIKDDICQLMLRRMGVASNVNANEADAERALTNAGATVERDRKTRQVIGISFRADDVMPPALLTNVARLPHCVKVGITGKGMTDDALLDLVTATQIESLSLVSTSITDDGVKPLTRLKKLKRLSLSNTKVGNTGMEHLAEMGQLEHLYLSKTTITDDGLRIVGNFPLLSYLALANNKDLTDEGVKHLTSLSNLSELGILRTSISLKSLDFLSSLKTLRILGIQDSTSAVDHLHHVRKLENLESLSLGDVKVTDDQLDHVVALPKLKRLIIDDSDLSADGISKLKQARSLMELSLPEDAPREAVQKLQDALPMLSIDIGGFPFRLRQSLFQK